MPSSSLSVAYCNNLIPFLLAAGIYHDSLTIKTQKGAHSQHSDFRIYAMHSWFSPVLFVNNRAVNSGGDCVASKQIK